MQIQSSNLKHIVKKYLKYNSIAHVNILYNIFKALIIISNTHKN